MKTLKSLFFTGFFTVLATVFATGAFAQGEEALSGVKAAIKAGSAKEVARYFNNSVEIGLNGDKSSYSQAQAEFVLRDFFSKTPSSGFEYLHQGSSNEGQKYAIGKYNAKGSSYRVFIMIKQVNGVYKIDTIDFTKE